ncbi:hypothetical protein EVA_06881 [gut metagenome]|uniref:Uncharacterized protein n=1 Tax=gut metagenome TaxID=749906 RepID=J9CXK6_9ZZZZ
MSITCTRGRIYYFFFTDEISQFQIKTCIKQVFIMIDFFLVLFPRFTVRRIGKHITKLLVIEMIFCNCITPVHTFRIHPFNDKVALTNSVSFWVDFCAIHLNSIGCYAHVEQVITAFCKHTA